MVAIPFPTSNNPGSAPGEGAGRLLNCYAYKDGTGPRWKPTPGLTPFASLPNGEVRGGALVNGLLILVVGHAVVQVDAGGGLTTLEEQIAGDGPVTVARNNAAIPDVTITSSNGSYVLVNGVVENYSTGVATGDFTPAQFRPNSVTFLDGYFLWTTATGDIWASGSAAQTTNTTDVSALAFTKAEAKPDGLLRGVVFGQQFYAMGTDTIEVYQDAATSPFPLARSTVIALGLVGQWAVAGYENGWGGALIFVAQDNTVRSLDGYTPTRVSNDDLENLIASVTDKSTLRASVYTHGGNAVFVLSSPTWTWEYNVTTGSWNERQSYGQARWRVGFTINAFGRWLGADAAGGALYAIDSGSRMEGTEPLVWGMDAGPVKQFPVRIQVPAAAFDFVLGQAGVGEDPKVSLSWSHDGGATWANPLTRSLGKTGKTVGRIYLARIGLSSHHGVRFRFRISDPAYTSFAGGIMDLVNRS